MALRLCRTKFSSSNWLLHPTRATVDRILRPRCTTHDEQLLVVIVEQNLVGIDAAVSAVTLSSHT